MRDVYAERRAFLMQALDEMGLPYVRPDGAFYVYVDITSTGKSSPEFCLSLLQDVQVQMFPARCSATTASGTCHVAPGPDGADAGGGGAHGRGPISAGGGEFVPGAARV